MDSINASSMSRCFSVRMQNVNFNVIEQRTFFATEYLNTDLHIAYLRNTLYCMSKVYTQQYTDGFHTQFPSHVKLY